MPSDHETSGCDQSVVKGCSATPPTPPAPGPTPNNGLFPRWSAELPKPTEPMGGYPQFNAEFKAEIFHATRDGANPGTIVAAESMPPPLNATASAPPCTASASLLHNIYRYTSTFSCYIIRDMCVCVCLCGRVVCVRACVRACVCVCGAHACFFTSILPLLLFTTHARTHARNVLSVLMQ